MRYARTLSRLVRKGRIKLVGIEQAVLLEIKQLRVGLPHVAGVLVASCDGLLIAQDVPGVEPESFAAVGLSNPSPGRAAGEDGSFRIGRFWQVDLGPPRTLADPAPSSGGV